MQKSRHLHIKFHRKGQKITNLHYKIAGSGGIPRQSPRFISASERLLLWTIGFHSTRMKSAATDIGT